MGQTSYAKAQGTDRLKRTVDRGFKKALNFYRDDNNALKEPKDVDQEEMSFSLDALCQALPKEELVPWMKNMLDTCPDGRPLRSCVRCWPIAQNSILQRL